jgi:tetratricopeptide (TPR) repeat protein
VPPRPTVARLSGEQVRDIYKQADLKFGGGEYAEAIRLYKQALGADATLVAAHKKLGMAYLQTGDNKGSCEHFKTYLKVSPDSNDARFVDGLKRQACGE